MKTLFLVAIMSLTLIFSCKKEGNIHTQNALRTVIIYMAADNNLYDECEDNINSILDSYSGDMHNNIVIYRDITGGQAELLKVEYDYNKGRAALKVIESYGEENSASAEVLKKRIERAQELFPTQSYGLLLWSHGFGWYPSDCDYSIYSGSYWKRATDSDKQAPKTKWFGQKGSSKMNIDDIAVALPKNFDFIIFDACLMACSEVAYALRDNTDYIVCSSAEVISQGFPYRTMTPLITADNIDYDTICRNYYNYYNNMSNEYRSATISTIKTSEISRFKDVTRSIVDNNSSAIEAIDNDKVQQFDRRSSNVGHIFVDAHSFISKIASPSELEQFNQVLSDVVVCKYATDNFFYDESNNQYINGGFQIKEHCGLTLYMPQSVLTYANNVYPTISWSK